MKRYTRMIVVCLTLALLLSACTTTGQTPTEPVSDTTPPTTATESTAAPTQEPTNAPTEESTEPIIPDSYGCAIIYGTKGADYWLRNVDSSECVQGYLYYVDFENNRLFSVLAEETILSSSSASNIFYVKANEPNRIYMTPLADLTQHALLYESNHSSGFTRIFGTATGFEDKAIEIIEDESRYMWLDIETGKTEVMLECAYISNAYVDDYNEYGSLHEVEHWSQYNVIYFEGKFHADDKIAQYRYYRDTGKIVEDHRL